MQVMPKKSTQPSMKWVGVPNGGNLKTHKSTVIATMKRRGPEGPTAPSTPAQSRSNVAFAEASRHPWVSMCLDPETASAACMPDAHPHQSFAFKTTYTQDLTLDGNGRYALRVIPTEANVLVTHLLTGTTTGAATSVANPDVIDLEAMSVKARLCCGSVSVMYTGRADAAAGKIFASKWSGDETITSIDMNTLDYDYTGPLSKGLYTGMFPIEDAGYTNTAAATFYNTHHSLIVYITGGPTGVACSITVTWNWELIPRNTSGFRGLGTIEPYDPVAYTLACNCMNREIVPYTAKASWKAKAKTLLTHAIKLAYAGFNAGGGWALARQALMGMF